MSKYAEVVVNVPIHVPRASRAAQGAEGGEDVRARLTQTFHYAIPSEWEGRLQPGHLVEVPFGKQQVQGIVIGLTDAPTVPETRYLSALVDPSPVLTPAQIALGQWISHHYLASLFSSLQLMLPPGLEQRSRQVVQWQGQGSLPPDLPAETQQVAAWLQEKKRLRSDQLSRRFPEKVWRKAVSQLQARGFVSVSTQLTPSRVRVHLEQMVRALTAQPRRALLASSLGRQSKETRLLQRLWESPDPLPTLESICSAAGCDMAIAKRLEKKGLVRIIPARVMVMPSPALHQDVHEWEKLHPAKWRAALEWLLDHPGMPVEATVLREAAHVTLQDLQSMKERGLVILYEEPAMLALTCDLTSLEEHLLTMRRLDTYLPILEFLMREGKPIWADTLCAEVGCSAETLRELAEAGLIALSEQERIRDPLAYLDFVPDHPPRLTPDQERVWQAIEAGLMNRDCGVYLVHGVTGSGKTEIYLRALGYVLEAGRQAIVLVPEISLTPQTIRRFAARFPGRITTIHSQLSLGERYDQWRRIRDGQVDIVIGPRSAVFAPLPRLGLLIVDEEHDDSYKSERMPTYHARDVALTRAKIEKCPVILGSATPSLESYYRATQGEYCLLDLPKRVMGHARQIEAQSRRYQIAPDHRVIHSVGPGFEEARFIELPTVEIVDLRAELRAGNRSIFSRTLQRELQRVLEHQEQAILFLNRRGMATNVSCRDCGYVVRCPRCGIPMTYHGTHTALICHHCNYRAPAPATCPECASRRIRYLGAGTERVEEEIHALFPSARTLRWDRDVTGAKTSHQAILDRFIAHQADILIGTQMIAKGLDLPLVTLVGVVLADTGLYLPDFRAVERTFQLIVQVAGRAGRSILGGRVIVQTYTPEHYSIQRAARHDFAGFYQQELQRRRELGYPPFSRLAVLEYAHKSARDAQAEAERVAQRLKSYLARQKWHDAFLAGPAPCFFARVRDQYRWQIVLRAPDPGDILAGFGLPAGWRVDIDPVSLL